MPLDGVLNPDVVNAFRNTVSTPGMIMSIGGIAAGGAAFVGLGVPGIAKVILPHPEQSRLADFLPFDRVLPDGKTIGCRNGTLVQCLDMGGIDDTFYTQADRDVLFLGRKDWIDALSETGVTIRVFTIREVVDMRPKLAHSQPVLHEVSRRWNNSFRATYRNRQIIALSLPNKHKNTPEKLAQCVDITRTMLFKYKPHLMSQHDPDPMKRPLTFWARLSSPLSQPSPAGVGAGASDAICADQVEFGERNGVVRFTTGDQELFCAVIGLRTLGDFTYEAFVTALGSVNAELVIAQTIEPWSKPKAAFTVTNQYRLQIAERFSPTTAHQFEEALDRIEGNTDNSQALTQYMLNIFVYGDTREKLTEAEGAIKRIATSFGIFPVREAVAAQAAWFCQFPGYTIWPRPYKLFSKNVASHVTLERPPEGLQRCDWGEGPLTTFRTASGTPYAFQFHVSEEKAAVAHSVCIGPTGGGKTTLINFLAGMALRHEKLRCYMVDRHGGAFIFCNAIGGDYITFQDSAMPGMLSAMNPFQCTDNHENRSFLRAFLQALAEMQDADSIEEIGFAIEAAFETPGLPRERRSLKAIYEAVFSKTRPVRKALNKWVDPAVYGDVFNAPEDNLDLASTRFIAFDFTRLYEHDDLARAVILYLMHRIQATISELRAPALIFIDETEPVVRHPIFRAYFMQMLQEYRKRSAAVVSAFQRPEAIIQAGLGEAIRGQAQTTFFFQNPQAQEREYADWGLTEREWLYIKGKLPQSRALSRSVLMKKATGESVILDTDLRPLGNLLRIYYSDEQSRALATKLMEQHGPDWLALYLDAGG